GHRGHRGHKGPKGPKGPKGEHGEKGPKGDKGPKGKLGERGPRGETGRRGVTGPTGREGPRGPTGPTGSTGPAGPTFEINDVLDATQTATIVMGNQPSLLVPFNPIIYPLTGLDAPGGMTLIQSAPGSGFFDTITLPAELQDTYYLVTYGI